MSDPADLGSEAEMVHLSDALCRQSAKPLPVDGHCLYCGQQTPGRHFCDSDHRDEYQWLADAARRAGQPIEALLPKREEGAAKVARRKPGRGFTRVGGVVS